MFKFILNYSLVLIHPLHLDDSMSTHSFEMRTHHISEIKKSLMILRLTPKVIA